MNVECPNAPGEGQEGLDRDMRASASGCEQRTQIGSPVARRLLEAETIRSLRIEPWISVIWMVEGPTEACAGALGSSNGN
jgi:hypothetical protein